MGQAPSLESEGSGGEEVAREEERSLHSIHCTWGWDCRLPSRLELDQLSMAPLPRLLLVSWIKSFPRQLIIQAV